MKHWFHRLARALARMLTRHGAPSLPGRPPLPAGRQPFDFDELSKELAQGLSRREALRRLGVGLGGAALASLGLGTRAFGSGPPQSCTTFCGKYSGTAKAQCLNVCGTCSGGPAKLCGRAGALVCCSSSQGCCNNACTSLTTTNNCGACGNKCSVADGTAGCVNGQCVVASCNTIYADCDNLYSNGCETNLTTTSNCGTCGHNCSSVIQNATPTCVSGTCGYSSCNAGFGDCNNNAADGCETPLTTTSSCGACGNKCSVANGTAGCVNGQCVVASCNTNYGNCDNLYSNGCETNLLTDSNNCGACGNKCGSGRTCCSGKCVDLTSDGNNCNGCGIVCASGICCSSGCCPVGQVCSPDLQSGGTPVCCNGDQSNCGGTCRNLQTDASSCGACGRACPEGASCVNGKCVCPTGQSVCSNACVNLQSDNNNCGNCGVACSSGSTCSSGQCTCGSGIACPAGQECYNGLCVSICPQNTYACGPTCCPTGQSCCNGVCCGTGQSCCGSGGGTCTDVTTTSHCGACGHNCSSVIQNATPTCVSGTCGYSSCNAGFGDCNNNAADGCETPLNTTSHCGGCGNDCGSDNCCVGGSCVATDTQTDPDNCGTCGYVCDVSAGECCVGGSCVATDTDTDPNNCGGCNIVCPSITFQSVPGGPTQTIPQICTGGICCPPGSINCSGNCVQSNDSHCGCSGINCADLNNVFSDHHCCSGACVEFNANNLHCGSCSNTCGYPTTCFLGLCI